MQIVQYFLKEDCVKYSANNQLIKYFCGWLMSIEHDERDIGTIDALVILTPG